MLRSRIRRALLLGVLSAVAIGVAAPISAFAAAPAVRLGSANVDGNAGEWRSQDFFGTLHAGSNTEFPARADAFARYDCERQILYVYVKARAGETVKTNEPNDHYIRINGTGKLVSDLSGDDNNAPDFRFVGQNGDAAAGWEASGRLAPGRYDIRIFTKVTADDTDGYDAILRDTEIGMKCKTHNDCRPKHKDHDKKDKHHDKRDKHDKHDKKDKGKSHDKRWG